MQRIDVIRFSCLNNLAGECGGVWETGCGLRGGFGNGNETGVGEIDEQAFGMNGLDMRH